MELRVANLTGQPRKDIARATIPFYGTCADRPSACVKIANNAWQIQFPVGLAPFDVREVEVLEGQGSSPHDPDVPPFFPQDIHKLVLTVTVDGAQYSGHLMQNLEVQRCTPLICECRSRVELSDGTQGFLFATTHWTFYAGIKYFDITVQLSNDYLRNPLGPVAFSSVQLKAGDYGLIPWFRVKNQVQQPQLSELQLLEESYLGDAQCKAWRMTVCPIEPQWMQYALAHADALGLYAVTKPWEGFGSCLEYRSGTGLEGTITDFVDKWNSLDEFGPFGPWGSVKYSQTTGTPLNTTCTYEFWLATQGEDPRPIQVLMGKCLQEYPLRPVHFWGIHIDLYDDIFLWELARASGDKLGRQFDVYGTPRDPYLAYRPREYFKDGHWNPWFVPHGWTALDTEHWSIDKLYDYYLLTGDLWAKTELEYYTQNLFGYMRPTKYTTQWMQAARAEGWTMKAWAQAYNVLQWPIIKQYMDNRLAKANDQRFYPPDPMAISAQILTSGSNPGWPDGSRGFVTWQHSAVLIGYMLAYRELGDARYRKLASEMVDCLNKSLVRTEEGLKMRYFTPIRGPHEERLTPDAYDNLPGQPMFGGFPGGTFQFLASGLSWIMRFGEHAWRDTAAKVFRLIRNDSPDIDDKWYFGVV